MHLFQFFYMYDFMLNVWSMWAGGYEFQLFLLMRIISRSEMKVQKECVDEVLSFTSEKLKRDIFFLILEEVQG